jgi:hypothetical protein
MAGRKICGSYALARLFFSKNVHVFHKKDINRKAKPATKPNFPFHSFNF